jgi:ribosomal protein S18 acetylase RimI-like enzyme
LTAPDRTDKPQSVVTIRHYQSRDRSDVRAIALETADIGRPIERILSFREAAADLLTRYYTDFEPESAWVAERDGKVVGYIIGTVRPHYHERIMQWRIDPSSVFRAIGEGALFHWSTWRLIETGIMMSQSKSDPPKALLAQYPAHLHINIRDGFRGGGVGRRLVETFSEHVGKSGLYGIHARVRGDNEKSRKFFDKLGFNLIFESRLIKMYYLDGTEKEFRIATYGKKL